MKYAFKAAARAVGNLDPNIVGKTLEDIASKRGAITATAVVDEARPEKHPLHGYFNWNDNEAAELYRAEQAGYLIRAVVVRSESTGAEVRAFVHVESEEKAAEEGLAVRVGDYRPIQDVMANAALRGRILQRAMVDLQAWERKYANLSELSEVMQAAQRVRERLNQGAAA